MYQYPGIPGRNRRNVGGCLTGVVVLLLVAGGLGFFITRAHNGITIPVGAHPTLIGDNCDGAISIQAGPANQITFASIFPQYTQDNATNTVELTRCDAGMAITVPPETNIQMDVNDEITVIGVSGTMKLGTNGNRLTLEGVTLEGASKLDVNGAEIIFAGSLAAGSTPNISDNGGSIDMTLPANASFHLAMTGIPGPIVSNVPGLQNLTSEASDAQANVGNNPSATRLTLSLNDTAVVLNTSAH